MFQRPECTSCNKKRQLEKFVKPKQYEWKILSDFFLSFFSIALESENCDITPDDLNEYINNSNPEKDFFEQITDFGLGTSIIGRVSVQGVKLLGDHLA